MHLIFLAHLWVCVPFLVAWVLVPSTHELIPAENFQRITAFVGVIVVYMIARTWLAFREPVWLKWEIVYPPIDVAIVSMLIWLGNRDPLSNIGLLYFFPLAQAASTLNWRWSVLIAALVLAGAFFATHGLHSDQPFNAIFRYFLMLVMASLFTMLAQASAKVLEQLGVARDRNRIAAEMHDGVQGHLVLLSKQLELAEKCAMENPARAAELAGEGRETARLAADELRYLVNRMRGPNLNAGFVPALTAFVHNLSSRSEVEIELEIVGEVWPATAEVEHAAFRITQEALVNVLRHSEATKAEVRVGFTASALTLSISDNGKGFSECDGAEGLAGLQRRANQAGGTLSVDSHPGSGTRLVALLPRGGSDE